MRTKPLAVRSDGLTLEGELVLPDAARALVILLHGFSGGGTRPDDPSDLGYPGVARDLAAAGFGAVWVNMRGVRTSPGDFSVDGWIADAAATVEAAKAAAPDLPTVLLGSSAGGYTALRVAAERADVDGVATFAAVATWDDLLASRDQALAYLRNVGMIRDPAFPRDLDAWTEPMRVPATLAASKIAPRPVLIVHGDADADVPPHHAEALFEAAGEPKELVRLSGGGHQLRRDPRALDAFRDWLERRIARRPA